MSYFIGQNSRKDRQGATPAGGLEGIIGIGTSPMAKIVQGVAGGIGLISESYQHNKQKKQARKAQEQSQTTSQSRDVSSEAAAADAVLAEQVDGAAWQLDEAQDAANLRNEESKSTPADLFDPAHSFMTSDLPPPYTMVDAQRTPPRLPLPVIITQRRPKTRDRGFIRAYAPVLSEVGINEITFLNFIDKLNDSVKPSPLINALNLASFAGMAVPEPFTILVSVAVQMATQAANSVHSRSKTNSFLDRLNAEFFHPRGLICVTMTWRPQSVADPMATVDFEGHIAAAADPNASQGVFGKLKHNLQSSSGAAAFEWPETAPLVFPVLDEIATSDVGKKKDNVLKRGGNYVDEYKDRRARAKWAGENADSNMANSVPKPKFHSRYADPNHPASSGDTLALLTGGHLKKSSLIGGGLLGSSAQSRHAGGIGGLGRWVQGITNTTPAFLPGGIGELGSQGVGIGGVKSPLMTGVKKIFQKDILYPMIVNLPTEQEMAYAATVMDQHRA